MSLLSDLFKPITKALQKFERVMNSAQTPEEFILEKKISPSIARIKKFLSSYSIHQTFKAKVYSSDMKLYLQNNCISIMLEVHAEQINERLWTEILSLEYPENTTMSVLYISTSSVYITITTKDHEKKRQSYKLRMRMSKIHKHIMETLANNGVDNKIIEPNQLLEVFNRSLSQPNEVEYDPEAYIYQQVPRVNNNISRDGYLFINKIRYYVIYTKQYPNITEDKFGIFDRIKHKLNDNDKYFYSINVELSNKFGTDQVLRFNTSFILPESSETKHDNKFINLLRHDLEWIVYSNLNFPLQQLLNTIPLQYDYQTAQHQWNYSTNQNLPITRIAQLIPSFGANHEDI